MSFAIPARMMAASGAIATALVTAVPAHAQQMGYEGQIYQYPEAQYAQPAPQPTYVRQPVVQQLPAEADYQTYETGYDAYRGYDDDYRPDIDYARAGPAYPQYQGEPVRYGEPDYAPPPYQEPRYSEAQYARPAPPPPHPGYPYYQGYEPAGYAGPQGNYGYQSYYPPMPPVIDRDAWISDCRAYLKDRRKRADQGAVAGGLVGAAGGAVIGRSIAKAGDKLGGALIGGGVGGLVGLFIGQAIALGKGDGTKRDCKNWLRTYEDSYARGGHWPAQGYYPYPGPMWGGWDGRWQQSGAWQSHWSSASWGGWWQGYVVVPQTTVIVTQSAPMVPVVREIVRETWVEEEVVTYRKVTPPPSPPAPKPKVRYIKTQPKPVKYIKGQ